MPLLGLVFVRLDLVETRVTTNGPFRYPEIGRLHKLALLLLAKDPQLDLHKAAMGRRLVKPAWHLGGKSPNPQAFALRSFQTVTRTLPTPGTNQSYYAIPYKPYKP